MGFISKTTSFVSGTTISASQVNTNFDDLVNGLSDGTKDIGINAATFTGAVDANSTLQVAGALTASSTARFAGAVTASAAVYALSTLQCTGALTASGTATVSGALTASSTASFAGAVYNESTTRLSGALTASGAIYGLSTLQCSGALTASSTARFSGAVTASAAVYANSTLQCTDTAVLSGAVYLGNDIHNSGANNPIDWTASAAISGFTGTCNNAIYYRRVGKQRTYYFRLWATSGVSDTCGFSVADTSIVGGTADSLYNRVCVLTKDSSTWAIGHASLGPGDKAVVFYNLPGASSWTAGAAREVQGQLSYEVD